MIYDIRLRMTYTYASTASGGRHLVRLMPADLPGEQRLVAGHLDLTPAPNERRDRFDFFGNRVTDFGLAGSYAKLAVRLTARVDRAAQVPAGEPTALARIAQDCAAIASVAPDAPLHFRAPSPRVPQDAAIAAYAADICRPGLDTRAAVRALGEALHHDMRYDPDATEVDTPAAEAFAARHGVCQDFSHVMIAGLRSLGVPAGYVSGFLCTRPPPGKPRLEGADAMHAWVRAWCGLHAGWVEYDPTNAVFAGEDHIVVARGRDYFDVSPIKGAMRVSGRQRSTQAVDVIPLIAPAQG